MKANGYAVVPARNDARWRGPLTTQGSGGMTITGATHYADIDWQAIGDRLAELEGWQKHRRSSSLTISVAAASGARGGDRR